MNKERRETLIDMLSEKECKELLKTVYKECMEKYELSRHAYKTFKEQGKSEEELEYYAGAWNNAYEFCFYVGTCLTNQLSKWNNLED